MIVLLTGASQAQDVHFSQYYLSPLSLNPANTGNYSGDWRLMANYRSQWKDIQSAYKTVSLGGDMNFYPKNQQVSGGLYYINDKSGGNLIVNKIYASGAVHKKINGYNISLGIQPGMVFKRIDFNAHTFPDQFNWNKGQFDNSTLANNEPNQGQKTMYFDLNTGLVLSKRFNKLEPGIGFSLFHITRPRESFYATSNRLTVRKVYNIDLKYYISDKVTINPYAMLDATTKASDWVSGINVEYLLSRTPFFANAVFAGFMWRDGLGTTSDAGIATVGFKYKNYTFGMSYDINVSRLHTATDYKGAMEFALIYTAKNTRIIKKQIPCDRY
ncbi:MAG: PorP/SprF family type IX secretion system membrane protein [Bacteroidia bacterium]